MRPLIKLIQFIFFLILCGHNELYSNEAISRIKYNFNQDWKLYIGDLENAYEIDYNDSGWISITLPFAWNQHEAFKNDITELSTGIAWYRKVFVLPDNNDVSKVFIEFEGIRQAGEFYLNGTYIGLHENGIMAVGFDVSQLIKPFPEENVIAVRVDNAWDYRERFYDQSFQWNDMNFNANYGGITKNVYLHTMSNVYQTLPLYSSLGTKGVYIYASEIDVKSNEAIINVESEVKNESKAAVEARLDVIVCDLNGNEVSVFEGIPQIISPGGVKMLEANDSLKNVEFWSWGYGYLYTIYSRLKVENIVVDEVKIKTGFRKTEYKNGMVYLNDRVIMMKGYAQRTSNEWPGVGMSVPAWMSDFSNKLMIESNANFVRWMHTTPWKQDVESCDRVGLIQVMPAGDSEKDVEGRQWQQRCEVMRDAIIYNRNNPSILFYEGGNENISEEHMVDLKAIRDAYDPYGGRAIGSREMLGSSEAEYGGEMLYINKSAGKPLFATEYSRDEGLRKYWDEFTPPYHKNGTGGTFAHNINGSKVKDASIYNHNQDSHAIENVIRWFDYWEMRPGTGVRVSSGGANIIFSDTNTHYRGAQNYRRSGEVDPMRIPKDNFYAHQVMWDGWVEQDKLLTHIIGHWNYSADVIKPVYVVSAGSKVELLVNGISKGFGENSYRFLYTFPNIKWEAGEIKAISYDSLGEIVSEDKIKTAGEPCALLLTGINSPVGFKADGADIALVQVEVVDSEGQRCPDALNVINFALNGEAKWIGGIAEGPENYVGSMNLPVECGVNRIMIRSTTTAGKIEVKATSKGLKAANIVFNTIPVTVQNGLREDLVADGLPSNLDKGPTPLTASYSNSIKPIEIVSVIAGANQENAKYAIDDNEETEWRNDGRLKSVWITFGFDKKSVVSKLVMKLSGWRRYSYPIEIYVDNNMVWNGNTDKSLGYISIKFEPVTGDNISVRLTGIGTEEDAFQNMIELSGNKELDGYRDLKSVSMKGLLRIVEFEAYE